MEIDEKCIKNILESCALNRMGPWAQAQFIVGLGCVVSLIRNLYKKVSTSFCSLGIVK